MYQGRCGDNTLVLFPDQNVSGVCRQIFFDEFEGIITGKVPLADMVKSIHETKIGQTGFLTLLGDQGTILSCPQEEIILHRTTAEGKQSKQILSEVNLVC